MFSARSVPIVIVLRLIVYVADGNFVNTGGRMHVSEGYGQDVFGQVVRKSHGSIAQLRQTEAKQKREIRSPLRALPLCGHGIHMLLINNYKSKMNTISYDDIHTI